MFSFRLINYDLAMAKLVGKMRDGMVENDELLSQLQSHKVSHGGSTRQVTGPQIVETEMLDTRAMFEISPEDIINTNVKEFTEALYTLFDSLHTEQKKQLFNMLSQTTEAVGNTVDAQGKSFWEAYLEMIEKTQMTFDEHGNHNYQIVLHPTTAQKLRENPPTEEQKRRIEEAIEQKRREYYERKPSRKLSH